MPKYGLDDTPETVPFIYACEGVRIDLRDCLVKSDCVTKVGVPFYVVIMSNRQHSV